MRHLNPKKILVSAHVDNPGRLSNLVRHADATCDLALVGCDFREVHGCYKGVPELAVVTWPESPLHERQILELARSWNQESVLVVHPDNACELVYLQEQEHAPQFIGTWQEVSAEEAADLDAYTYDPESGRYFAAVGRK